MTIRTRVAETGEAADAGERTEGASDTAGQVVFRAIDGRVSATLGGREVVADAAMAVDVDLAERIRTTANWRRDYIPLLRELTAAGGDGDAAVVVAQHGLDALERRVAFERGGSQSTLRIAATELAPAGTAQSAAVQGRSRPIRTLRIPYRGRELEGPALRDQLHVWAEHGVIEASVAERIAEVQRNPDWMRLEGRRVVLVGAGSEIGPLEPLCAWGADVVAVDVPVKRPWQRIREVAECGAGCVHMPLDFAGVPGFDIAQALPETSSWLERHAEQAPLVLGMYAYADGAKHVLATAAFDALAQRIRVSHPDTALAFMATPTDTFIVPSAAVAQARARYAGRRLRRLAQAPAKLGSGGRLFRPAYANGSRVADALIAQQGANYALAKRLQRWRGLAASADGAQVSFNVAPATWTRSVTKNRILAAAYSGAGRFGIEIFRPETTRTLMAAMLVYDLHQACAAPGRSEALFSEGAAHGGLWRAAYEPRSVLGLAAAAGLPGSLVRR
jgi:hypothetical protein